MAYIIMLAEGASVFFKFSENIHGADFLFGMPTKLGFFNNPEKRKIIFAKKSLATLNN
jgi:hypothetical protein